MLKTSKNPDKFGTNVLQLKIEYKHKLSEVDKVAALVWAAGPEYTNTISKETKLIKVRTKRSRVRR